MDLRSKSYEVASVGATGCRGRYERLWYVRYGIMKRAIYASLFVFALGAGVGCKGQAGATEPPSEEEEENLIGAKTGYDEKSDDESLAEEFGELAALPEIQEPKEKCKGKGKKKECKMVDPTPEVTAAHGARRFLSNVRWGMSPERVMDQLTKELEVEYDKKQETAADAVEQDKNREWLREQRDVLAQNHVMFEERARHKWGVSLIQFEYEDDANEEMVWVRSNANLKKFYFFKDGELWKVLFAYSENSWPGKKYEDIVKEKFHKWFGVSPEEKVKTHPETNAPLLRYNEWKTTDGDIVRSFDMTDVQGSMVIALIDGDAESSIGERLPNMEKDETFVDDVSDALGGTDVCYDDEGNLIESAERCAELGLE